MFWVELTLKVGVFAFVLAFALYCLVVLFAGVFLALVVVFFVVFVAIVKILAQQSGIMLVD